MKVARDEHGNIPAYAWPGGYPVIVVMDDGETLCPECANDPSNPVHEGGLADGWRMEATDIHYEGPPEVCAHCNKEIESAYGDPESAIS